MTDKMDRRSKTHFTRKNWIAICLILFFLLIAAFCSICCDADSSLIKANNPLSGLGSLLGFPKINASFNAFMLLFCFLSYVFIFAMVFIYEMRLAVYYENRVWTKKYTIIYIVSFLICLGLFLLIGLLAQYPYDANTIGYSFLFVSESLVVAIVVYIALFIVVGGAITLYINFKNIDKPYRFFSNYKCDEPVDDDTQDQDIASSFGDSNTELSTKVLNNSNNNAQPQQASVQVAPQIEDKKEEVKLSDREIVFPGLSGIDFVETHKEEDVLPECELTLKDIAIRFRNYLAKQEKLYFDIDTIRAFLSGLSASRLIILEGLSGTGKSSLARYFSDFITEESYFEPVQATWHDRTSILGYYNDFSKTYNETEFLKRLYDNTYRLEHINIMVLDEINISRVEYYFADFLSILEYPMDSWKLKIMQLPYDFEAPEHLADGMLQIPYNTWFIGTANKDDSTYTITDKVYDRAIAISFNDRNEPFEVEGEADKIQIGYKKLIDLFEEAELNKDFVLNKQDYEKFRKIIDFTYDTFDITFGNRIMHQIELLTPVYVASGGNKEDALDFMFARKVLRKLDGRFEDYIKDGLENLIDLIDEEYGKEKFNETRLIVNRLIKKL